MSLSRIVRRSRPRITRIRGGSGKGCLVEFKGQGQPTHAEVQDAVRAILRVARHLAGQPDWIRRRVVDPSGKVLYEEESGDIPPELLDQLHPAQRDFLLRGFRTIAWPATGRGKR